MSVDIIKSGGYKISALEIENVLLHHDLIQECAVIGVEDTVWGERVCAAVSLVRDQPLALEELRSWSKQHLASYKIPQQLVILGALPRNSMGKILKRRLRKIVSASGPDKE